MMVVMNCIGSMVERWRQSPSLEDQNLSAAGNGKQPVVAFARRNIADQRGAVALETLIVMSVLLFSLLLPLADIALAGFQAISAWEALRSFGQYIQYPPNTPPDVTNTSAWASTLPTSVAGYPINNVQVLCGDTAAGAACTSANISLPTKYYSYTTTITLSPMVLRSVLCPSSCTYILPYSERFQ
jgi:hypothetical protein